MRIPIVLAILVMVMSVLIDLYIYYDIRRSTRKGIWSRIYLISSWLCWIFIAVVFCVPKRSESSGILPLMWMLYSYFTVYVAKLVYLVISLIGLAVNKAAKLNFKGHPAHWIGFVLAVAVFVVMWVGVVSTRQKIVINRVNISSEKVPSSFNGFTIAQISDLHVGTWGNDTTFISNLVDSVNSLNPDLVVFTGDVVNRKTEELVPFINTLSRLKGKYGVMSILGNHDYGDYVDWHSPDEREVNNMMLESYQKFMGWDLLNNARRFIKNGNDSIMIIGVENWGDPPFPVYGDLEKALSASLDSVNHQNDSHFKVLLTHNPEHWNRVVSHDTNIDLSLAGHTHAMQMMLKIGDWEWSPAKYRYEQWGGLYERDNDKGEKTRLYVNIGAGEVGMPARIMSAYPEVTLITLYHDNK